jgi:hypothetical protein
MTRGEWRIQVAGWQLGLAVWHGPSLPLTPPYVMPWINRLSNDDREALRASVDWAEEFEAGDWLGTNRLTRRAT